jgi:hypothetical protein
MANYDLKLKIIMEIPNPPFPISDIVGAETAPLSYFGFSDH